MSSRNAMLNNCHFDQCIFVFVDFSSTTKKIAEDSMASSDSFQNIILAIGGEGGEKYYL